jgi:hypothetical protein
MENALVDLVKMANFLLLSVILENITWQKYQRIQEIVRLFINIHYYEFNHTILIKYFIIKILFIF